METNRLLTKGYRLVLLALVTRASVSQKMQPFPSPKGGGGGGHGPRRSMQRQRKLGTRNTTLLACDRIRCFESFGKYRATYVHLTYKDVDLFPKGSVFELYYSKPAR